MALGGGKPAPDAVGLAGGQRVAPALVEGWAAGAQSPGVDRGHIARAGEPRLGVGGLLAGCRAELEQGVAQLQQRRKERRRGLATDATREAAMVAIRAALADSRRRQDSDTAATGRRAS